MKRFFLYTNVILICIWAVLFLIFQFSSYHHFIDLLIKLLKIEGNRREVFVSVFDHGVFSKLKWLFLGLSVLQTGVLILVVKKPGVLQELKTCITSVTEYP